MQRNALELIKPSGLVPEQDSMTDSYGKFVAEPLERGYGTTIGNSLRRVLLSSLPGAAICAMKLDGAVHEFTVLPEVKEDVTDIVLSLKEVRMKMHGFENRTARLDVKGPKVVTAQELAERFQLSLRTIYRDIKADINEFTTKIHSTLNQIEKKSNLIDNLPSSIFSGSLQKDTAFQECPCILQHQDFRT